MATLNPRLQTPGRPGRPPVRWYDLEQLSELLDVPVEVLERACGPAFSFFPHGKLRDGVLMVPEHDVRALLGQAVGKPMRMLSIPTMAMLLDCTTRTIRRHIAEGRLHSRIVLGREMVPEDEYCRVVGLKERRQS